MAMFVRNSLILVIALTFASCLDVHHLMEKMGGKISYESESGKGTTFILKFQKPNYDFINS